MAASARPMTDRDDNGKHWSARPLPEPPRTRQASRLSKVPPDRVGKILEDWKRELTVGFTVDGD